MAGHKRANEDEGVLNEGEEHVGEKAFEDVTDMKNEDFIYFY